MTSPFDPSTADFHIHIVDGDKLRVSGHFVASPDVQDQLIQVARQTENWILNSPGINHKIDFRTGRLRHRLKEQFRQGNSPLRVVIVEIEYKAKKHSSLLPNEIV